MLTNVLGGESSTSVNCKLCIYLLLCMASVHMSILLQVLYISLMSLLQIYLIFGLMNKSKYPVTRYSIQH